MPLILFAGLAAPCLDFQAALFNVIIGTCLLIYRIHDAAYTVHP